MHSGIDSIITDSSIQEKDCLDASPRAERDEAAADVTLLGSRQSESRCVAVLNRTYRMSN